MSLSMTQSRTVIDSYRMVATCRSEIVHSWGNSPLNLKGKSIGDGASAGRPTPSADLPAHRETVRAVIFEGLCPRLIPDCLRGNRRLVKHKSTLKHAKQKTAELAQRKLGETSSSQSQARGAIQGIKANTK